MGFVIVVDGHNFLNDLNNNGKSKEYVMNELSFRFLQGVIQDELNKHGLRGHPFIHTYFVCSARKRIANFTKAEERDALITKLKTELGVSVDEISLYKKSAGKDEEVDMHVFIRMLEMGPLARPQPDNWRHVVLMSKDRDFVPTIRMLSQMGTHTVVVGFDTKEYPFPIELKNESWLFLELGDLLEKMERAKGNERPYN